MLILQFKYPTFEPHLHERYNFVCTDEDLEDEDNIPDLLGYEYLDEDWNIIGELL